MGIGVGVDPGAVVDVSIVVLVDMVVVLLLILVLMLLLLVVMVLVVVVVLWCDGADVVDVVIVGSYGIGGCGCSDPGADPGAGANPCLGASADVGVV